MGRVCTVCTHEERQAIDRALIARNGGYRAIARAYGVTRDSLRRHTAAHIPLTLAAASHVAEQLHADDLVGRLVARLLELHDDTLEILDQARDEEDHALALQAIARAEKQIELQARLLGELKEGVTINLFKSDAWVTVVARLVRALDPFPEAKLRVAEVLRGAE